MQDPKLARAKAPIGRWLKRYKGNVVAKGDLSSGESVGTVGAGFLLPPLNVAVPRRCRMTRRIRRRMSRPGRGGERRGSGPSSYVQGVLCTVQDISTLCFSSPSH